MRQEGQDVTCESCPHYFVLDTDPFEIGTLAKCSPPIRDLENQKACGKLFNGEIDCGFRPLSMPPEMKAGNIMESVGGYRWSAKLHGRDVR